MSKKQKQPNDSMVFFRSFYEAIKDYPKKAKAEATYAIIEYALYGTLPQSSTYSVMSAFNFAKPVIDNTEKRRKRNIENGKKGGAPKGNKNACKKNNRDSTEIQPKNNLYTDMDKKVDMDMDMDMDVDVDVDMDVDTDESTQKEPGTAGSDLHTHGEYNNVLLTSIEMAHLINEFGHEAFEKSVTFLSRYLKRKPDYKSACHFEDLRSWVQDAVRKEEKARDEAKKDSKKQKRYDPFAGISFEDIYEKP